jgi:hypothetical protein
MVMNKIVLTVLSLMFESLMTVVVSQPTIEPVAASNANGCAAKQNDSASARQGIEMDGIRFEAFIRQEKVEDISREKIDEKAFIPASQEIKIPKKTSRDFFAEGGFDAGIVTLVGIYIRATNCTNQEIRFGRWGSVYPIKLVTSDGQEVETSGLSFSTPVDLTTAGSVLVKPGEFVNLKVNGDSVWEGNSLTMRLTRGIPRSSQSFRGLQPGKTYQFQLTYSNDTNQKTLTDSNNKPLISSPNTSQQLFAEPTFSPAPLFSMGETPKSNPSSESIKKPEPIKEIEVWKGKVTPPIITFRLDKLKN